MPNITQRNFSGGWQPGNDFLNGDPSSLLQMDNVDLDTNGALTLIGGTATVGTAFTYNLHSLYSRVMNGARVNYSGDTNGGVNRNNTSIATGGSTSIAAFGTAFDYTLICSGTKLKKDNGTTAVNLGITAPTSFPIIAKTVGNYPQNRVGSLIAQIVTPVGASAVVGSYIQLTANGAGSAVIQTNGGTGDPHNLNALTDGASNIGFGLDTDTITVVGYTPSPVGKKLQLDILLAAGGGGGALVSDYYSIVMNLGDGAFDPTTGTFTFTLKREDFQRIGTSVADWSATYGFRLTYTGAAADVINVLGSIGSGGVLTIFGGSHAQNGTYEYMQVDVSNTSTYQAKSIKGASWPRAETIENGSFSVLPSLPVDAQVNQVWLFRRGGLLDKWYRVGVFANPPISTVDAISDIEALTLNITFNDKLISTASIPDPVLVILGPINKRWYYFTKNLMYPSDIDNPDLVDSSIAIRLTGSNSEVFLWAEQVDVATVLVGTSVEIYKLSGTFSTFPDFSLDIYYHGMGCNFPPISYDSDVFGGSVIYLANDGWRSIDSSNANPLLVTPFLDILYKGISRYTYAAPNLKIVPGAVRFPFVIAKNKIWCFITGTNRCEVYDLTRKYWRTFNYSLGDVTAAAGTQDGQVLAFYGTDKKLREIDVKTTKLIDGTTKQTVQLLFVVQDGGAPRNRKDASTFKSRIYTGGSDTVSVTITNELSVGNIVGTLTSSILGTDKFIDLSSDPYVKLCKTYQVQIVGIVSDFTLEDWSIDFSLRPDQVNFVRVLNQNFGSGAKKRLRNWPQVLDSLGHDVTVTQFVDSSTVASTTLNTSDKLTSNVFYNTDVLGVDYGLTLHSPYLFEYFGAVDPLIVQVLPVARRFDQVGPEEFFKYGKIKQIELRVLPLGGSSIPYTIYMSDLANISSSIAVTSGVDDSYYINMPKGTNGRIARITFGPTSFDMHRFYVRLQVSESGKDTELNWITVA